MYALFFSPLTRMILPRFAFRVIKKSIVDPSNNQAEKKAIDFFVHSVHSMGDSYVGDSEYYVDEDNLKEFIKQLNVIERMAIEFYKKIKP